MAYDRQVKPFVEPPAVTEAQFAVWTHLAQASMDARKWSVPGASQDKIDEAQQKLHADQAEMGNKMLEGIA